MVSCGMRKRAGRGDRTRELTFSGSVAHPSIQVSPIVDQNELMSSSPAAILSDDKAASPWSSFSSASSIGTVARIAAMGSRRRAAARTALTLEKSERVAEDLARDEEME